jgi:uncharacterized protein (DUF488 family)
MAATSAWMRITLTVSINFNGTGVRYYCRKKDESVSYRKALEYCIVKRRCPELRIRSVKPKRRR